MASFKLILGFLVYFGNTAPSMFLVDGVPLPGPSNQIGSVESSNGNHKASFSTFKGDNSHHDIFYGYAGANREDGVRYGAGLLDHSAMVSDNFGVKHKIGVVGAELDATNGKLGSMARVTALDGTLQTGPVDVNYGVNIDTGVKWDRGLEAKLLGMGGTIRSDRVEACFIVCLGFSWG